MKIGSIEHCIARIYGCSLFRGSVVLYVVWNTNSSVILVCLYVFIITFLLDFQSTPSVFVKFLIIAV